MRVLNAHSGIVLEDAMIGPCDSEWSYPSTVPRLDAEVTVPSCWTATAQKIVCNYHWCVLKKTCTLQGTNISPKNGILKMIFLFPRWDMLVLWRVHNIHTQSTMCMSYHFLLYFGEMWATGYLQISRWENWGHKAKWTCHKLSASQCKMGLQPKTVINTYKMIVRSYIDYTPIYLFIRPFIAAP